MARLSKYLVTAFSALLMTIPSQCLAQAQATHAIGPKTLILILTASVLTLLLLLFVVFRLYNDNQIKTRRFAAKVVELENEVNTNQTLTDLLNNIFESSLHGIMAFTSVRDDKGEIIDFTYQMVNKIAAQLTEKDLSELIDNTLLSVIPGNKESGLFDAYKNVVNTGEPMFKIIYYNYDHLEKWLSISAVKNHDGFIVTFSDISEIKGNEQLLLHKQQELEEVNYELEQFAYIASHDLQEPLRKVRAFGDRLEANYSHLLDDKGRDFIVRMQNASARMQTLIDNLLKFSRATKSLSQMVPVDLNKVLHVAQELLSETINDKEAVISCDPLPHVLGNDSQLVQLFLNLLSNALKYVSKDMAPEIAITLSDICININNEPTDHWQISIRDNGIGFDNAHKDKIFDIFQRLHARSEYEGTGIGLAICLKIVNNHQGYIFAESEQKRGATFVIQLPKIVE